MLASAAIFQDFMHRAVLHMGFEHDPNMCGVASWSWGTLVTAIDFGTYCFTHSRACEKKDAGRKTAASAAAVLLK